MRLCFPCAGADLVAARTCERVVFGRYYGNTPQDLAAAYGPYEDSTSFGAVLLPDGGAIGAVRLLRDGPAGLKTLNDAAGDPWRLSTAADSAVGIRPARTWDVGTFGVDSLTSRGWSNQVTMALFSIMFGAFRDNDVDSFIAVMDRDARRPIAALGVLMADLPGAYPAPYLGSPASVPAFAHVQDLHEMHAVRFANVHEQVFHGRNVAGLDPAMGLPGSYMLPSSAPADGAARQKS